MVEGGGKAKETESMAIVALVLGIAGIFVLPLILSIPAVIVGKKAEEKITASGGALGGAELAKAGVITGWIGIGLAAVGLVVLLIFLVVALVAAGSGSFSGL